MSISCSPSASLMESPLPTKPSSSPHASLASCNSVFFSNGGRGLPKKTSVIRLVPRERPTSRGLGCRCLFGLGVPEIVVIAGVATLVFGPKKLPEIGRSIGKTLKSFQQAAKEFETELKKDTQDGSEPPAAETLKSVSSEDEKKEL